MAQTTTVVLIPQTAHPIGSETISLYGDRQQAAAYYLANKDLQTITWHFSGSFNGTCKIQASLVTDPSSTDWFDIYEIDVPNSKDGYHNQNGNFVWLRAVIGDWSQGTIQLVTASY